MATLTKSEQRIRRHSRVRSRVEGTAERPRLAVYKSNTRLVAQLIDDDKGVTLAAVSSVSEKGKTPQERVESAAKSLVAAGKAKGITKVVFDRGGFQYAGRIKALADAAREGGLQF